MASGSLLLLLDDITAILDDVSILAKVAAKKTAGVLGDDLALNAQQVSGVQSSRELPVVWAVAKGSMINKIILVPLALLISSWMSWAIVPLLMLGGAYLCYEGFEKIMHKFLHSKEQETEHKAQLEAVLENKDLVVLEKNKIKGAIRTDFILSAEIITIALGVVANTPFLNQVLTLSLVAVAMTVFVYGFVGLIVKLDDIGLWLVTKKGNIQRLVGNALIDIMPYLMKGLTIVGTAAMFLVGGGIITHGIPALHHAIEQVSLSTPIGWLTSVAADGLVGIMVGALVLALVSLVGAIGAGVKTVKTKHNIRE